MIYPPPSNADLITDDRGAGKIKLSDFIRTVFGEDELDGFEDTFFTTCSEITRFYGGTITGYENECDAAYRIPDDCKSVQEFNALARQKIMDVYKISLTDQVSILEILNIIDNSHLN